MERIRFTSHQDIFKRLDKVANYATLSPEERRQYDYDLKKARDYHAELAYARKEAITEGRAEGRAEGLAEGRAEGLAEGLAEGRTEANRETARRMLELGLDYNIISASTGLSLEDIKSL